ncbi:MAG TPA: hypothetical protein VIM85_07505 [Pseudomonadales bacterium]
MSLGKGFFRINQVIEIYNKISKAGQGVLGEYYQPRGFIAGLKHLT